jgi:hypothetical protein
MRAWLPGWASSVYVPSPPASTRRSPLTVSGIESEKVPSPSVVALATTEPLIPSVYS